MTNIVPLRDSGIVTLRVGSRSIEIERSLLAVLAYAASVELKKEQDNRNNSPDKQGNRNR